MRMSDLITEIITMRRLDGAKPRQSDPQEDPSRDPINDVDDPNTEDMPYLYPDDEPDFDFGDAPQPDEGELDFDINFGDNTGNESSELSNTLNQPPGSPNLNSMGLNSGSASTPGGKELEKDLSAAGEDVNGEDPSNSDTALDQLSNTATEDPNKQGVLRAVNKARLIYKRQTENGTYEELWIYNISKDNAPDSFKRRRAILAGTDIPPNKSTSPDGSQTYDIWTTTNAELIRIKGLQN